MVFSMVFISSCQKEYFVPIPTTIPDSVSFSANVIPVFNEHCNSAGCHNTGGISPDLSPENAYDDLYLYSLVDTLDPVSSVLYTRMISTSRPMPPSVVLKNGEPELVLKWTEQGGLNN